MSGAGPILGHDRRDACCEQDRDLPRHVKRPDRRFGRISAMRVCMYTDTALPLLGGQEMVIDALCKQYIALGHEPTVLAPPPRHLSTADHEFPYPVIRHPRFISTRHFVDWYKHWLERAHRRNRFDILHCHSIYPCGYLAAPLPR